MFGFILVPICVVILLAVARSMARSHGLAAPAALLLVAYAARIALQFVLGDLDLFSSGNGAAGLRGDSVLYEFQGMLVAQLWDRFGFQFADPELIPQLNKTTFPAYLFGTIIYLNGGVTLVGCVAVVALFGCLTCYNLYLLALEFGADDTTAFRILILSLFSPGFLLYTSDTAKDGLVAFFATTVLSCGFRIARRFELVHVLVGLGAIAALWFTRFYLVYMTLLPLTIGILGGRQASKLRTVAVVAVLGLGVTISALYTDSVNQIADTAQQTFESASSSNVLEGNASSGSGILFDDGGNKWASIHWKVLYTLFAPFPWAGGSLGMQIGKLDTLIWYYLFYRACKTAKELWRADKNLLLMFMSFLLPATIAYATTISNVGLIYRQRIPIVLLTYVLAAMSWSKATKSLQPARPLGSEEFRT